eukprot:Opistho-2@31776
MFFSASNKHWLCQNLAKVQDAQITQLQERFLRAWIRLRPRGIRRLSLTLCSARTVRIQCLRRRHGRSVAGGMRVWRGRCGHGDRLVFNEEDRWSCDSAVGGFLGHAAERNRVFTDMVDIVVKVAEPALPVLTLNGERNQQRMPHGRGFRCKMENCSHSTAILGRFFPDSNDEDGLRCLVNILYLVDLANARVVAVGSRFLHQNRFDARSKIRGVLGTDDRPCNIRTCLLDRVLDKHRQLPLQVALIITVIAVHGVIKRIRAVQNRCCSDSRAISSAVSGAVTGGLLHLHEAVVLADEQPGFVAHLVEVEVLAIRPRLVKGSIG